MLGIDDVVAVMIDIFEQIAGSYILELQCLAVLPPPSAATISDLFCSGWIFRFFY